MVLFPVSVTYALAKAVEYIMAELMQTGTTEGFANRMWQFGDFYRFIEVEAFRAKERTYLEHGNLRKT